MMLMTYDGKNRTEHVTFNYQSKKGKGDMGIKNKQTIGERQGGRAKSRQAGGGLFCFINKRRDLAR